MQEQYLLWRSLTTGFIVRCDLWVVFLVTVSLIISVTKYVINDS